MINGHGDDIYTQGKKIVSNFSSNIYNHLDMSALYKHLCDNMNVIHSYPEPDASSFVKIVAESNNISSSNIIATNGATEAIYLIAQAFKGKRSAILYPTFSEYADACAINDHSVEWINSLDNIPENPDLIWLCNPNNPTGRIIDADVIREQCENNPSQIYIIDQSYEYFTDKELLTVSDSVKYKNVIILHSLTKHFAIPGLRLGYMTGHAGTIAFIRKYCMPWSVNALAIEAGKFLLDNGFTQVSIPDYIEETERLKNELGIIDGMDVLPSDMHFFLCRLKDRKAADLKKYLVDTHSILIRDASNFYGLDESYFRIATQSPEENDQLVKAIKEWILPLYI